MICFGIKFFLKTSHIYLTNEKIYVYNINIEKIFAKRKGGAEWDYLIFSDETKKRNK